VDGDVRIVNHDGGANDGDRTLRRKLGKALALAGAPPTPPGIDAPPAGLPQQAGDADMRLDGNGADVQHGGSNADLLNDEGNPGLQPGGSLKAAVGTQTTSSQQLCLDGNVEPANQVQPDVQPAGSVQLLGSAKAANNEQPVAELLGNVQQSGTAEPANNEQSHDDLGANVQSANNELPEAQPGGNVEPAASVPDAAQLGNAALIPGDLDMVQSMARQSEEPSMRRASLVPSPLQHVNTTAHTPANASLDIGTCPQVKCATGGAGDNTRACSECMQLHHNGEPPARLRSVLARTLAPLQVCTIVKVIIVIKALTSASMHRARAMTATASHLRCVSATARCAAVLTISFMCRCWKSSYIISTWCEFHGQ
jgi:hypothetical protein